MSNDCADYPAGQCTWYVCSTWPYSVGPVWGNASAWLSSAAAAGYSTGATPVTGAIAVWGPNVGGASPDGHVAIVTAINPTEVTGMDWPEGAGVATYVIGTTNAPGEPSGYIYPPGEDEPMTQAEREDVASALVQLFYAGVFTQDPNVAQIQGRDYWYGQMVANGFGTTIAAMIGSPQAQGILTSKAGG